MKKTALGLFAALGAAAVAPTVANASVAPADRILNPTSVAELPDPVATLNDLQQRQLEAVEAPETQAAETVVIRHRWRHPHHWRHPHGY